MYRKASNNNEKSWRKKVEKYERDGMSNDEAKKKADSKIVAEDTTHVLRMYSQLLLHTFQLEHGVIHQRVMEDVHELVSEGMILEQAIQSAIKKHSYLIEGIVKSENDDVSYGGSDDSDGEGML